MRALVLAPFARGSLQRLREHLEVTYEPWIEKRKLHDPKKLAARLRRGRYSVLVVEADFLVAETFASPTLRVAGVCRNALNQVDLKAATERGIPVIHTPSRNSAAVAELAIGLMLSLARHVPAAHEYVSSGGWTDPTDAYVRFRGRELGGSTVGIIGLGQIGAEVAQRVRCLGARVIAADPFVPREKASALGVRLTSLPQLLRQADFVTMHTPQSKATEGLVNGAKLDLMKRTAYIVNTGSPQALDYDALAKRLRGGRLAGAALDVFSGFVMPPSSPLRELDNVILTPHIGGATGETVERHSRMITDDILRFLRGNRLRHVANPEVNRMARGA